MEPQVREQMSGPHLHVFTLKPLTLKKLIFHFFGVKIFYKKGVIQLFSVDDVGFSKKKNFLTPKKWKNGPQKLLIIGPDPFISQSSPDHNPQPRIDFSYYEISGQDICSLICVYQVPERLLLFTSWRSMSYTVHFERKLDRSSYLKITYFFKENLQSVHPTIFSKLKLIVI